jgi:hypothetical protein
VQKKRRAGIKMRVKITKTELNIARKMFEVYGSSISDASKKQGKPSIFLTFSVLLFISVPPIDECVERRVDSVDLVIYLDRVPSRHWGNSGFD